MKKVRFISTIPNLTVILKSNQNLINHNNGMVEYVPGVKAKFEPKMVTVKDERLLPSLADGLATVSGGASIIKSVFETADPVTIKLAVERIQFNKNRSLIPTFKLHPEDEELVESILNPNAPKPVVKEAEIVEEAPAEEGRPQEPVEEKAEEDEGEIDLDNLNIQQLGDLAKSLEIPGRSAAKTRDEKVALIKAHLESQKA